MPKILKKVGGDSFDPATDLKEGDKVKKGSMGMHTYIFIKYENNGDGINALIEPVAGGEQEIILASQLAKTMFGGKRKTGRNKKSLKVKRSAKYGKTRKSKTRKSKK